MSSKFLALAFVAPLALDAIASGSALARNAATDHYNHRYQHHHAYGYQPFPHGTYTAPQSFEPPLRTDPDPRVRFDLNRDSSPVRN
jgi:hypothetical protein